MLAIILLAFSQAKMPEGLPLYKSQEIISFLEATGGRIPLLRLPIDGKFGRIHPEVKVTVANIHDDGSFTASMTSWENNRFEHQTFRVYGIPTNNLIVLEKINLGDYVLSQSGILTRQGLGMVFRDRILEVVDPKVVEEGLKAGAKATAAIAEMNRKEAKAEAEKQGQMIKEAQAKKLAAEDAKAKEKAAADLAAAKAKQTAAQVKARDSIAKLIRGLANYEQRYEDSFKESKESVMDQMQEQARTYVQGADKRLEAAIKELEASKIPEDERAKLIEEARGAIAKAKKKVGIK